MADKKISIQFDASMNVSQMQNALKTIQNQFNGLQLSANAQKSFLNLFSKIENQIKDFQAKSEKGISSMADFNAIDKSGKKIIDLFDRLKVEVKSITNLSDKELLKLFPEALGQTFKTATKDLEAFGRKLESSTKKAKELQEQITKAKKEKKNAEKKDPAEGKRRVSNFEADKISKEKKAADKALRDQEKALKQAEEKLQEALSEGRLKKTKSGNFDKRYGSKNDKELIIKVQEARQLKDKFEKEVQLLFEKQESIISEDAVVANEEKITIAVQKALETIKEYTNELNNLDSQDDFANSFKKAREEIEKLTGLDLSSIPKTAEGFQEMQDVLNRFKVSQIEKAQQSTEDFENSTEEAADVTRELNDQLDKNGQEVEGLSRASREVDVLKSRILDFFSISNAIQLFKNAIRNAYETVKELDKAMTETAVVTDFSVGDMWDQLPRYTAAANELGTTTLGAYKTMTLFYQQGLKTNEAFEVGIETMKMARIGNLEYAQATNLMTAALRGFNMELNETSAQRVNDVYSELAAITAADTEEIAKAMTKTASIANSANMEFETTAAFLSQIVETTRESAETAGTAMKTVIARFQELKKSPDEIGEVDGEVVDANQIEGALRTVGVALRDSEGQFRNLDDVFLELASKWDGLDRNTQRYIATIAAGSRQQSRFLAMMSDYDRTMELVSAANNSAGASQRQYEKTLDSLESKLNKLKDAWDEFTMGLTNSELIKGGVDALTSLINRINVLTDILPGATSSIAKLGLAFLGMKGGGAIFNTFLKSTKAAMKDSGEVGAMSFNKAFSTNIKEGFSSTFKKVSLSFKKSFGKNDNIFGTMLPDQDKLISMIQQSQAGMSKFSQGLAEDFETINQQGLVDIDAYEEGMERIRKSADVDLNNFLPDGIKASTEQLEAYNAALRAGNSPREAAIILAQSMKESEVAQQKVLIETNKQQALQNTTMVQSVGIKTTSWIATKLSTLAEKKFIGAKTASTIAEKVLTKAIESRTAATLMGLGVIGLVVAALYGLYKLIDYGIQQAKDQSFIYTLQGAQQATDQAKESAQKATEAYDNLNSSLDELGKKYKNLENLTKGTGEWKEAVVDTNQAVLELVEQYGLMAKNKNGVLTIDMNSQEIKDKQTEYAGKQLSTQQALISAQKWQTNREQAENFGQLDTKIMANNQEAFIEQGTRGQQPTVMANRVITDELARGLIEGLITPTLSEVNKWLGSKGALQIDEEGLADIINYGKDLQISDERLKSYSEAQAANIVAALDKDQFSENQFQWSSTFLSGERMSGLEAKEYDILENLRVFDKEQYEKEKENFAKTKGYDYINGKFYVGEGEEQQEVKISDQDFKNEYAAMKATENATSAVSIFAKTLEKVNDEFTKKLYKQEEGKALTQKDIFGVTGREEIIDIANLNVDEEISDTNSTLYKKADQIWQSLGQEGQSLYENEEVFIREYLNSIKLAAESFASSSEKMAKVGVSDDFENKFSRLSSGAFSGLADKMYDLFITSGSGPTQAIQEQIASMVNAGDEEAFINALNMLDIHDIDSIEKLDTYLKNFNITVKGGIPAIEALEDSIKAAAKATRNWDLEKVKEELKAVQDLERDLQQRDPTDRVFSEQQVNLLLKEMPELQGDFVMTGIDEFTYVGDSMDKLTVATEALRQAYLQQHIDQVDDRFETSNKWKNIMNGQSQKVMNLIDNTPFEESSASESTMGAYSYQEIQKQQEQYQQYQEQSLDNILSQLGLSLDGDYETRRQRMIQHYNEYYGTNGAKAEQIATEKNNLDNGMIQLNYAKNSAFEVLNTPTNGAQERKAQELQVEGMIKKEAGAAEQVNRLTEALKQQGNAEKYAATTVKGLVVDNIKAEKQIKTLTDTVTKNKEAFITGNKALKAGETASNDYYSALADIEREAKKVFGDFITQDFIQDNEELFEQLAEGGEAGEKAYLQIQQAAHDAAIETLRQDEAIVGSVEEIEAMVNQANLDFTVNGYADMTDLVNKMLEAYKDVDVVKQKIEELTGMSVEFEVEYQTVEGVPFNEVSNYGGQVISSNGMFATIRIPKRVSSKGAIGIKKDYKGAGISSKSSGGGKQEEPWENPYDQLYNDVQKINKVLREREKIERRYQKILESEDVNSVKLTNNIKEEISNLKEETNLQKQMLSNRKAQMDNFLAANSDLSKYGTYQNGMVQIDWEKINKVKDKDEGEKINTYIDKLEELSDEIKNTEDAFESIEDAIDEIRQRGKEDFLELETRIKDDLVDLYQEQIDKLSKIDDSINETNSNLIASIQRTISQQRQDRENAKTEKDLADKQTQLDYLMQDTSGANDLAAMQLQEEINQGQKDYTDTLIDQKINELQMQNEDAAAQREREIAIAQGQLDHFVATGQIWQQVESLMEEGLDREDGLIRGSKLEKILKDVENFDGLSKTQKMTWLNDLNRNVASALTYISTQDYSQQLEDIKAALSNTSLPEPNLPSGDASNTNDSFNSSHGTNNSSNGNSSNGGVLTSNPDVKTLQNFLNTQFNAGLELDGKYGPATIRAVKQMQRQISANPDGYYGKGTREALKLWMKESHKGAPQEWIEAITPKAVFKKGGLADFTGSAWLDGTRTHPELILNARDTENFIQLKDILGQLMSNGIGAQSSENYGDNNYDIDINVESIGNDYDVEQLASKVKTMINDTARYRNNNAINLLR